jgi:molybdopterin converting factor small subunit
MARIQVKVIGPLIYKTGFSEKEFDLDPSTTIRELVDLIGVPSERPRIVTRNGAAALPDDHIADGDKIAVSPIYSGG